MKNVAKDIIRNISINNMAISVYLCIYCVGQFIGYKLYSNKYEYLLQIQL